jgi:excisionase family DNA binding protein
VKPEARLLLACRERIEVLQRAPMKHVDPRIHELFRHLRGAVDLLEQLILQLAALPPAEQTTQSKSKPEKPFAPTAPPHDPAKLAYTVREACKNVGVSRTTLYRAIQVKDLRAVKCGHRTLILARDLQTWIDAWPIVTRGRDQ